MTGAEDIGGALWINLANTLYLSNDDRVDELNSTDKVLQWLLHNGVVKEEEFEDLDMKVTVELMDKLVALRTYFLNVLQDLERQSSFDVASIHSISHLIGTIQLNYLISVENQKLVEKYKGTDFSGEVLFLIFSSFINTINQYPLGRIKVCEDETCILHFLDTSKAGKRRWCSMKTCGNRNKAARFYSKKNN